MKLRCYSNIISRENRKKTLANGKSSWERSFMDLVFSWYADGGVWPEHPGQTAAVVDKAVVGASGLLDHVETMLGLGRPETSNVHRIAVYRQKLKESGGSRFWSASFDADSWSATRELLNWRDELISAGWKPGIGSDRSRLADLSAAENAGPTVPFGQADRLRLAIETLQSKPTLTIKTIQLIDKRAYLPNAWRALLDGLETSGVKIIDAHENNQLAESSVKLTLIKSDTEIAASELLASWLGASSEENKNLVFILGKDTALLDHYLRNAGLPRLGKSTTSPHRSLLQILPLAYALAWDPPNPISMLDFLLLPVSPLSRQAANQLASVVAKSPGIGSDDWHKAWENIEKSFSELENADPTKDARKLKVWRAFLEPERFDPFKGMTKSAAREIAGRVASWATQRSSVNTDPLLTTLVFIASDLERAIEATQQDMLDRVLIERMIEQAIGTGVADPMAFAEAAPWRSVSHPGAIWGQAKTIIWWNFADTGEVSPKIVWNEQEREALFKAGCPLDEPQNELNLLAAAWERPLRYAVKDLIFIRSDLNAGDSGAIHPLWHSLVADNKDLEREIGIKAETVLKAPKYELAGRILNRRAMPLISRPERRSEWSTKQRSITPRSLESATSLISLLACPLQWTLTYASKLYPGARQSLPNIDTLVGTLAHKISQEIFRPGDPPTPEIVESFAASRMEELLPQIAATLLLPGAARELAAARMAVPQALGELARFLHNEGLSIVATEYAFESPQTLASDTGMKGSIDLLARRMSGDNVVIDLKWQRSDKYRRSELKMGAAFQLAIYARHISDEKVKVATGYFMLRQRRFLTVDRLVNNRSNIIQGPTAKETWDQLSSSWTSIMQDVAKGKVTATFDQAETKLEAFSNPPFLAPPKCTYCNYAGICKDTV